MDYLRETPFGSEGNGGGGNQFERLVIAEE